MKQFQSVVFGATFAATTAALVAFAPSSAHAIQLSGSVGVDGNVNILTPDASTVVLDFTAINGVSPTPIFSSFLPALTPSGLSIKDLTLAALATPTATANFATGSVTSFLDFGIRTLNTTTGSLTFDLDAATFLVTTNTAGSTAVTVDGATGIWRFDGNTVARGSITATDFGSGTFAISLRAEPVPEPLTMGGLALGAGFGAFLKTRYSKKDEQLEKV
ncbi:PEP-CTERM sorting domain-containing protein [Anabaena subtropica]|uniref:PEP-CTERM sorting domain-containing protein n=1 Tax=Anabaena subtropica FACHB-260 TaxID=2692884 RepID=A0ABR8CQL8_9NOST|nr:PEP-CTERM sorting domain-containing protein [Anabaena subtropica]MBD2345497.1 PEP-CTERM sorting domain-containing protein [Anabaena subtropica FACHB-260]